MKRVITTGVLVAAIGFFLINAQLVHDEGKQAQSVRSLLFAFSQQQRAQKPLTDQQKKAFRSEFSKLSSQWQTGLKGLALDTLRLPKDLFDGSAEAAPAVEGAKDAVPLLKDFFSLPYEADDQTFDAALKKIKHAYDGLKNDGADDLLVKKVLAQLFIGFSLRQSLSAYAPKGWFEGWFGTTNPSVTQQWLEQQVALYRKADPVFGALFSAFEKSLSNAIQKEFSSPEPQAQTTTPQGVQALYAVARVIARDLLTEYCALVLRDENAAQQLGAFK